MQRPTMTGIRIRSVQDAHVIFHAVSLNMLPMITRRLDADERMALNTGCVYAWEERGANTEVTGLGIERFTEGRRWGPSRVRDEFLFYYEKSPPTHPKEKEGKSYFKQPWDPLVKQTYSVWVDGPKGRRKWHLTAYFTQSTVDRLCTIDDVPSLYSLVVPPDKFISTRQSKPRPNSGKPENQDAHSHLLANAQSTRLALPAVTPERVDVARPTNALGLRTYAPFPAPYYGPGPSAPLTPLQDPRTGFLVAPPGPPGPYPQAPPPQGYATAAYGYAPPPLESYQQQPVYYPHNAASRPPPPTHAYSDQGVTLPPIEAIASGSSTAPPAPQDAQGQRPYYDYDARYQQQGYPSGPPPVGYYQQGVPQQHTSAFPPANPPLSQPYNTYGYAPAPQLPQAQRLMGGSPTYQSMPPPPPQRYTPHDAPPHSLISGTHPHQPGPSNTGYGTSAESINQDYDPHHTARLPEMGAMHQSRGGDQITTHAEYDAPARSPELARGQGYEHDRGREQYRSSEYRDEGATKPLYRSSSLPRRRSTSQSRSPSPRLGVVSQSGGIHDDMQERHIAGDLQHSYSQHSQNYYYSTSPSSRQTTLSVPPPGPSPSPSIATPTSPSYLSAPVSDARSEGSPPETRLPALPPLHTDAGPSHSPANLRDSASPGHSPRFLRSPRYSRTSADGNPDDRDDETCHGSKDVGLAPLRSLQRTHPYRRDQFDDHAIRRLSVAARR